MADGDFKGRARPCGKFQHPDITADGQARAHVAFDQLDTLWINTGTVCNVACDHCYIESSPINDRLVYLTADEVAPYLREAKDWSAREIGFTGGEPFMNPEMAAMAAAALAHGFTVLILTNAMRPMMRPAVKDKLLDLRKAFGARLKLRVSLDHYRPVLHDEERGAGSFAAGLKGLRWLHAHGFALSVAGRLRWGESEAATRSGFAELFAKEKLALDAHDPAALVLFPEMNAAGDPPEITTACWGVLNKRPQDLMCATSRMVVKRKGARAPVVLSCTLLAYDEAFEMGARLKDAMRPVKLNHPHCATFCVLGGASCSG